VVVEHAPDGGQQLLNQRDAPNVGLEQDGQVAGVVYDFGGPAGSPFGAVARRDEHAFGFRKGSRQGRFASGMIYERLRVGDGGAVQKDERFQVRLVGPCLAQKIGQRPLSLLVDPRPGFAHVLLRGAQPLDGTLVMPFGYKGVYEGRKFGQRFMLSYDQGRTWSRTVYQLHTGGLYASSVVLDDGTILTVHDDRADTQRLTALRWRVPPRAEVEKAGFFEPGQASGAARPDL